MLETWIWVIPAAVAGLGALRPRAGLLVFAASLPLFGSPPGGPYLTAFDVAAIAAILTAWRGGPAEPSRLTWPTMAFVLVSLASLVPSPYQPPDWQVSTLLRLSRTFPDVETWSALYTWRAAADLILGWGLFMAVRRAFAGCSPAALARAVLIGLGGATTVALASEVGLVDLTGFRPSHGPRLASFFFNSGWFAEYLVLATPPAVAALVVTGGWRRRLTVPVVALALACLGLTYQRGAWVAALVQVAFLGVALAIRPHRHGNSSHMPVRQALLALVLAAAVFVATGSPVEALLGRGRSIESGLSERVPLWTAAVEMTRERPLLGWGLGSFAPAYDLTQTPTPTSAHRNHNTAHSLYLGIASEMGLLGLFAFGLVCWTVAACLRQPTDDRSPMALALSVALVGAMAHGLVQHLFHIKSIGWLLWLLLGCVALVEARDEPTRASRTAFVLIAIAALVLPFRALVAKTPQYAGNGAFGFHEPESDLSGPFRWTQGRAAKRIPWTGEVLILELANGHPKGSDRPVDVVLGVNGEEVARLRVSEGWEAHAIELGPPNDDHLVLTLDVSPTFRPFSDFRKYPDLEPSQDIRSLGVATREPRWKPSK